jgi:hypothetical protein
MLLLIEVNVSSCDIATYAPRLRHIFGYISLINGGYRAQGIFGVSVLPQSHLNREQIGHKFRLLRLNLYDTAATISALSPGTHNG